MVKERKKNTNGLFANIVLITLFKYCENMYEWKYVLCYLNNTTKQVKNQDSDTMLNYK